MKKIHIIPGIILIAAGALFAYTLKNKKSTKEKPPATSSCGIVLPQPKGYVNDFVYLFTESERWELDSMIGEHEKQTTNQVAIITFDSSMMGKCSVEEYTLEIGKAWGVGQKEKNNGVVIGIAPSLRRMRIANGYGIEKILPDAETQIIIDSFFIPWFKKNEYFEGTKNGLNELFRKIK